MSEKKSQKELIEETLKKLYAFTEDMKKTLGLPIYPDTKTGVAIWLSQREINLRFSISVETLRPFLNALAEQKILTAGGQLIKLET